jgi:predicted DNA-binding antitoxin AbrB/MazE fold protein
MKRQLEAVFEHGVLRPLEPLALEEQQHVLLTITDVAPPVAVFERKAEEEWVRRHEAGYRGQWVALDGDVLVSRGLDGLVVRDEARRKGVQRPLVVQVPCEPEGPATGN